MKMLNRYFFALILFNALGVLRAQAPFLLSEVRVHPDGAVMHGSAVFKLDKGIHRLQINELPRFAEHSLQLKANHDFTLISKSTKLSSTFTRESNHPHLAKFKSELSSLEEKQNELNLNLESQTVKLRVIQASLDNTSPSSKPTEIEQLSNYASRTILSAGKEVFRMENDLKDIQNTIEKVNQKIDSCLDKLNGRRQQLVLEVELKEACALQFKISFLVPNAANWSTSYNAYASQEATEVKFLQKATIFQTTGLDWNNIKLSLSNAPANFTQQLPPLRPWYIPNYAIRQKTYSAAPGRAEELMVSPMEDDSQEPSRKLADKSQLFNQRIYKLPAKQTILSDENSVIVLDEFSTKAKFYHKVRPAFNTEVFLVAALQNGDSLFKESGSVDLFLNNQLSGRSFIQITELEELELIMGANPEIIVERQEVAKNRNNKVFSDLTETYFKYRIRYQNKSKVVQKIRIEDRIPISREDSFSVESLEQGGGDFDSEKGFISWEMELQALQTGALEYGFKVVHPSSFRF
jgi:uncharacterized protein (TIGR02231 family)